MLLGDCKFNVRNTLPELQHEFCTLWNEIVLIAQENDDWTMAEWILKPIRNIYVALHHDTNSAPTQFSVSTDIWDDILSLPSSYPVCKVADHVHVNSPLTSSARTIPHDPTAIPPSLASPDILPSSTPVPLHVIESPTDVLSLDDTHPAQATIEGPRNLVLSADLPTANVMQDFNTSDATAPLPAPETSTAAPLFSSPPSAVSLQYHTDQLIPSNPLNLPSIASLNPVLDAMLPTGPSLSSHSPITRPSSSPSFPESHRSIIISIAPNASPGMTFAPDPDVPTSLARSSCEEKDTFDLPSVNRPNITVAPDLPLQSSLPLSTVDSDVSIAGPSPRETTVECTGDHTPRPSDFRHDIF